MSWAAPWPAIEELGSDAATVNTVSPLDLERARDAESAHEAFGLMQTVYAQNA